MSTVFCSISALTVAAIFYGWRAYRDNILRRRKVLCERVAYMLWKAAKVA